MVGSCQEPTAPSSRGRASECFIELGPGCWAAGGLEVTPGTLSFSENVTCPFPLQLPSRSRRQGLVPVCGRIPGERNSLHRQVEQGSVKGLCGLRDPAGPQELLPATGGTHVTEQMVVPGPAWLWRVGVGWAGDCIWFSPHLGSGAQP